MFFFSISVVSFPRFGPYPNEHNNTINIKLKSLVKAIQGVFRSREMDKYSTFYCPITGDLMNDPVIDREGNSYERVAIEEWLTNNSTSPITRSPLRREDLTPNRALQQAISEAKTKEGDALPKHMEKVIISQQSLANQIQEPIVSMTLALGNEAKGESDEFYLHGSLSVVAPKRIPSDIVVVIDNSGSMATNVTTSDKEYCELSILDIVKHSVKTIIKILNDEDRLSIVKFSTNAAVMLPLTPMTAVNKDRAISTLESIEPEGSTNIWDGLSVGMDVLKSGQEGSSRPAVSNGHVLLLTDGEPNIVPPRGHIPMLAKYQDSNGGKLPGSLLTFGFGYSLDSSLLRDIARFGGGMYSFIPDAGFVGTAFINALSNILSSAVSDITINVETGNGVSIVADASLNEGDHVANSWGSQIKRSSAQIGQTFDFIKRFKIPTSVTGEVATATVTYRYAGQSLSESTKTISISLNKDSSNEQSTLIVSSNSTAPDALANVNYEIDAVSWRLSAVSLITTLLDNQGSDVDGNKALLSDFIVRLRQWITTNTSRAPQGIITRMQDLLKDISGQVSEAISRSDWFQKWGRHYLRSLARSHELQQANNFKDPGIQHYGGDLFKSIRDVADDIFCKMPAPTASTRHSRSHSHSQPPSSVFRGGLQVARAAAPSVTASTRSMTRFHDRNAVCFHGDCTSTLMGGDLIRIRDLQRGHVLANNTRVLGVIKTLCVDNHIDLVHFSSGLKVTSWHPIRVNGKWTFPNQLADTVNTECDAVFSVLLQDVSKSNEQQRLVFAESIQVDNIECIALAHGIVDDPVASHPFFGTQAVVDAMCNTRDWVGNNGIVVLSQSYEFGTVKICSESGLICGLVTAESS